MPPPKAPVIENVGLETFLPIVISSVAVVFGSVGAIGCRMIAIPPADPTDTVTVPIEAGVFAYRDGSYTNTPDTVLLWDACQPYKDIGGGDFEWEKDGLMGAMQGLAIVICAVGCLTVLGMWSSPCFPIHEMAWKAYGAIFFVLGALQIVTTQVNSTIVCTDNPQLQYLEKNDPTEFAKFVEGECVWDRGIRFCITASCLWFIAGIVTLRTAAPRKKPMN
mmetsp:Transcript_32461/g.50338  ORF Transcript_32461/g.50338 Transcript_32461/m.50338 type:complete len:220 (+) Transcript_32461:104-763(+)